MAGQGQRLAQAYLFQKKTRNTLIPIGPGTFVGIEISRILIRNPPKHLSLPN
jgi:hypothetical protein